MSILLSLLLVTSQSAMLYVAFRLIRRLDRRPRLGTECANCQASRTGATISGVFQSARSAMRAESRAHQRARMGETSIPRVIDPDEL